METLIKSTTDAMREMMQLIKSYATTPTNPIKLTDEERKRKRDEKRKKYNEATVCTHSGKKHPLKKEDDCWELEKKTRLPTQTTGNRQKAPEGARGLQ
jgi:hypothetical protein